MGRRRTCQASRVIDVVATAISYSLARTPGLLPFLMFDQKVINCLAQEHCLRNTGRGGQRIQEFCLFRFKIERLELEPARRHYF